MYLEAEDMKQVDYQEKYKELTLKCLRGSIRILFAGCKDKKVMREKLKKETSISERKLSRFLNGESISIREAKKIGRFCDFYTTASMYYKKDIFKTLEQKEIDALKQKVIELEKQMQEYQQRYI